MKIILYNILWCYIVVCYPGESVILSTECFKFIACCWEESAQCGQLRSHCGCEAPRMEENKFATACIYWNSLLQNIFITWRAAVQKPLHISLFPCLRTACLSTHKLQCSMERGEASLSAISVGWRARFLPLRDNTYHFFFFRKLQIMRVVWFILSINTWTVPGLLWSGIKCRNSKTKHLPWAALWSISRRGKNAKITPNARWICNLESVKYTN